MTVTTQIGKTFESILTGAPIGLVGSIGWELLDPTDSSIVIAHRTSGINEPAPGSYYTTDTAPLAAGEYLIVWDYAPDSTAEALVAQVAPIIGPRYATSVDLRNYTSLVQGYSDDDLNDALREAERWIDSYVPPAPIDPTTNLKYAPLDMPLDRAIQLNYATCAQAEYILHMGPGFFISGTTTIVGGDFAETRAPKIAPKAKQHLLQGRFIRLMGRVSPDYRSWRYGYGFGPESVTYGFGYTGPGSGW